MLPRKLGANEPKFRLQLFSSNILTSDGFDSVLSNEADFGTKPKFQHPEERPFAF
jgi:hypothetical protein